MPREEGRITQYDNTPKKMKKDKKLGLKLDKLTEARATFDKTLMQLFVSGCILLFPPENIKVWKIDTIIGSGPFVGCKRVILIIFPCFANHALSQLLMQSTASNHIDI